MMNDAWNPTIQFYGWSNADRDSARSYKGRCIFLPHIEAYFYLPCGKFTLRTPLGSTIGNPKLRLTPQNQKKLWERGVTPPSALISHKKRSPAMVLECIRSG